MNYQQQKMKPINVKLRAVLLKSEGRPNIEIAKELKVHIKTLEKWYRIFKAHKCKGLKSKKKTGRRPALGNKEENIKRDLSKPPTKFGFDFCVWTLDILKKHALKTHNKRLSDLKVYRWGNINCEVYSGLFR